MVTKISGSSGIDKVEDGSITPQKLSPVYQTAALAADVLLTNTALYFDGPALTLGVGVWLVIAKCSFVDTSNTSGFFLKLWDGTTVIDSTITSNPAASAANTCTLAGIIVNPAGPVKASIRDGGYTTGILTSNTPGNGQGTTISAVRIG